MSARPDLHAATTLVARTVEAVPDDRLDAPTPCPDYSVGDLLDHVAGLSTAFTWAARKEGLDRLSEPPAPGSRDNLVDDWRTVIPARLRDLATAWESPDAWDGMTQAGGVEMPGEVGGLVALNEVLVHGWDLAAATGQSYEPDAASLQSGLTFASQFDEGGSGEAFGPKVATPAGAPELQQLLAHNGRDIAWRP
ncbi:TIGR03086 family metal-binding protein [Luteipulveratus halotolerans]|uniref:Mycothiol-dependent maleylpyruvate isomerase metal-binding domain-containing protein n=1 Tax=Luteipulveratus halotolerans TaxID=1631356 RepID=A0A0L6CJK8_9MICO|nr:TIGR03086 family metal-binding protein [Luteipulveratus halotolerans]KNX37967.1 hypothetical protein VV01_13690 [Luteipulveratus halotolerans]